MKQKRQVKSVILETIKKQKMLSAGILTAVIGAVVAALIPPLILAKIIDTVTAGNEAAFSVILLYFVLLALTGILEAAREGLLTVFGQKITHALRSSLMDKFVSLTADSVNKQEPGTLVSRFVGDVDTVENLFTSGIISMFADVCKIISILVVIWFQNRGLTLVLLVLLPFLFWFTRHVQKNMLAAQIENRKAVGRASGHVPETLHNIRTIHCLAKEAYMEERYDTYIGESYAAMERTNFYDAVYSPVILILNAVVVAVVMLLSASGNHTVLTFFGMSAGTAVAVINYISQIFSPVESLGMEIQTIQSATAGIHRINEFFALDEKQISSRMKNGEFLLDKSVSDHVVSNEKTSDVIEDFEKDALNQNADQNMQNVAELPFVEFRNVTFGYDEHVVLDHLNFQVKTGEQVTLSGRTGAGKSTIMKLLLGLYEPQSGEILLRGVPVTQIQEEDRRNIYGYVEQTFHMVPGTVRDQITLYDPRISDQQVKAVTEPELLLLDEITANLDAETELEILQALKRVSQNRTVISISHRTSAEMGRIIEI